MRRRIAAQYPRIESALIEWAASGWLDGMDSVGGMHVKGDLQAEASPVQAPARRPPKKGLSPFATLETAASKAAAAFARLDASRRAALAAHQAAQAALDDAMADKKRKKEIPDLESNLAASEAAAEQRREAAEAAKAELDSANAALRYAQAEAKAKVQQAEQTAMEARLRQLHEEVTGRAMPCRLPHVLREAHAQVHERPSELVMTSEDLHRVLTTLSIAHDRRVLGGLFGQMVQLAQSSGVPRLMIETGDSEQPPPLRTVSLTALRCHCGVGDVMGATPAAATPASSRGPQRPSSAAHRVHSDNIEAKPSAPRPCSARP